MADAHRNNGKRFIVTADEETADHVFTEQRPIVQSVTIDRWFGSGSASQGQAIALPWPSCAIDFALKSDR